jgi:hypothetical protein
VIFVEKNTRRKENPSINSTPKLAIFLQKDAKFFYITKVPSFFSLAKFHQIASFFSNWGEKLVFFDCFSPQIWLGWGGGKYFKNNSPDSILNCCRATKNKEGC